MSLIQEFKETDPREEKKMAEARASQQQGKKFYSPFCDGITPYKFNEGSNLLRLLPQRVDSQFNNYLKFSVLSFFDESLPMRGSFRVMDDSRDGLISKIRWALKGHPEFKHLLWSPENESGISFSLRPRVAFLGFEISSPERAVSAIVLPGTLDYPTKDGRARTPQAGSKIIQFSYDVDINDNLRYGNIFSATTGKVVRLDVTNAGTVRVKYDPSVDADYPLTSKEFAPVLRQIKAFDEFISTPTDAELIQVIRLYLSEYPDVISFLDEELNLQDIVDTEGKDEPTDETVANVAKTKPAAVPLPEEDEDEIPETTDETPADPEDIPDPDATDEPPTDVQARLQKLKSELRDKKK